jgi:hypothetical protein
MEEMRLTDEAFNILGFSQVCLETSGGSVDEEGLLSGRKDQFVQMHCCHYAFR